MLRPRICAVIAAALVAAALPAHAESPQKVRVENQSYVANGLWISGHGNLVGQHRHITIPEDTEPFVFDPAPRDRKVLLEFDDAAGLWPAVVVHQEGTGPHHLDEVQFCARARHLDLHSTKPLEIWVYSGFCLNHTYGVATRGTITATFTQ